MSRYKSIIITTIFVLILQSCTLVTREQAKQLQDVADRLEMRTELNERAEQLVSEAGGHSAETSERLVRQLQYNSELSAISAETIREVFGRSEESSD